MEECLFVQYPKKKKKLGDWTAKRGRNSTEDAGTQCRFSFRLGRYVYSG